MRRAHARRRRARSSRARISPAALSVNVTARICDGAKAPVATWFAIRRVIVVVFPDPAPARMQTGPRTASTARRCSAFSPAKIRSASKDRSTVPGGSDGFVTRGCRIPACETRARRARATASRAAGTAASRRPLRLRLDADAPCRSTLCAAPRRTAPLGAGPRSLSAMPRLGSRRQAGLRSVARVGHPGGARADRDGDRIGADDLVAHDAVPDSEFVPHRRSRRRSTVQTPASRRVRRASRRPAPARLLRRLERLRLEPHEHGEFARPRAGGRRSRSAGRATAAIAAAANRSRS